MRRSLSIAGLLFFQACAGPVSPRESEQLRNAERRWARANIDNYTFEMRSSCFCPPEVYEWAVVEVRDGIVVAARTLGGAPLSGFGLTSRKTVEQLFDQAHARYDWLEDIDFEFDDVLGYPLFVELRSKSTIADAGVRYEARNLVPLSVPPN